MSERETLANLWGPGTEYVCTVNGMEKSPGRQIVMSRARIPCPRALLFIVSSHHGCDVIAQVHALCAAC